MNDKPLHNKKIAVLVAGGFNETDMTEAGRAFIKAGATVKNISTESGLINSWQGNGWGLNFMVDATINTVLAADFDMLFIPSGERSVAKLSENPHTKRIIRGFADAHKPAAIQGDAVKLLALAERADGFAVCGDSSCKDIMIASGAEWISDISATTDRHIVTGSGIKSNPDFIEKMISLFCGLESEDEDMQNAA